MWLCVARRTDKHYELGVNSGNWAGQGAFYGSGQSSYLAGWTGVKDSGSAKSASSSSNIRLGMTLKVEQ